MGLKKGFSSANKQLWSWWNFYLLEFFIQKIFSQLKQTNREATRTKLAYLHKQKLRRREKKVKLIKFEELYPPARNQIRSPCTR
jgi:hypothetical protein